MENKLPKKRGRKPKTNIIVNNNPIFKNDNFNDVIICINSKNTNLHEYTMNIIESEDISQNNIETIPICCNNCNIKLSKKFIELPITYKDNIFYVSNKFCSFECANRYSFDNYYNYNEILSLLYLYKDKITNSSNSLINLPLPISTLKHNGGTIPLDKYRKKFKKIDIINLVCTLNHSIEVLENNNINNNKLDNLRLSRKNKNKNKNKNNIFYKMNLNIPN